MIFEKLPVVTTLRNFKQLRILSHRNLVKTSYIHLQSGRAPINLLNINHSVNFNLMNDVNSSLLAQHSKTAAFTMQQNRTASTQGDHVRLWVFERLVAATLPVLLPITFIAQNPITDGLLALLVVMHTHWGLEAIITDYARPIVVGPVLPKMMFFALNVLSAITLAGLLVLIYNGPGIAKVCKDAWTIGYNRDKSD